jgi:hypothetical protein
MIEQGWVACFDDKKCLLVSKRHGKFMAKNKQNKL